MDQVSLDTTGDAPQISLDPGNTGVPVSPDVINKRADKAYHGSGPLTGQTRTDIHDTLTNGNEAAFRTVAAASVDADNASKKSRALLQATTPEQLAALHRWNAVPQDPNSVIEDNYGKWFANSNSPLFNFREYVNTQKENADAEAQGQGWVPWLEQQALNFIPGYYNLRMNWTASDYTTMWKNLLDPTNSSIADSIYEDPATAREKFDKGMASLAGNPTLQSAFAHLVMGQTNSEKVLNGAFNLADIGAIPGAFKFGNGVAKSVQEYNSTRRAVRSLYEAAGRLNQGPWSSPTVAKAMGEGRVGDAVVEKAGADLAARAQGNSNTVRETIEDLPSNWRIDEDTLEAGGGGRYGSGMINLVKENWDNYKRNVLNVLQNTLRVNRTPIVEASQDVVRMYKENLRGKYKGPQNTLMDIEGPVHDLPSNSYMYTYIMGTENREAFETAQQAANASRDYGYPAAEGLHERINREVGPKLTDLEYRIKQLEDERKTPPEMDADVNELNRWNGIDNQINELKRQRDDLMAYHAEHLVGPEVRMPGSEIKEIGKNKYVIKYNIPQEDVHNIIRDGLIYGYSGTVRKGERYGTSLDLNDTTFNHIRSTLDWMRTPGETLSPEEVASRVIATHGAGAFLRIAQENSAIIAKIPRAEREAFSKVLKANQDMLDPHTGLQGYYFETIPELEDHYLAHIGRMPSRQEIAGYFANKQNWDYDRVLRGLLSLRNKNRVGVESHSIEFKDNSSGRTKHSPYFDGVSQNYPPAGEDLVAIMGDSDKSTWFGYADSKGYQQKIKKITKDIVEGRKQVVEIHDVDARPLASFLGDNRAVRYVITDKFNRKQISLDDQLGRRGGGHWDFNYDWAIKQANMIPEKTGSRFRDRYEGDNFVSWVDNEAVGKDFVQHFNRVNELIDKKDWDGAKQYWQAHMRWNWEDAKKHWLPQKVDGVVRPPLFNSKEPFYVVRKDRKIGDIGNELANRYPSTFYDATKRGSIARTQQIQYTGERDARQVMAVERTGDWRNPVFDLTKANFVDPFTTMDRALSRIINSSFMEDYKMMGVEHWLRNAENHLELGPKGNNILRDSPWHVFNSFNPTTGFKKETPDSVKRVLTNNWKKIMDFVGTPSGTDRFLQRWGEHIANDIYKGTGKIIPTSQLPHAKNPLQFMRSAVFDMKFLFSPGTFFTQFSTFVNVGLINLKYAPATTGAMIMHQLNRINANPNIVAHAGKLMETFGWRPGEYEEARNALLTWSNFFKVGNEHAMLDSMVQNRTISNQWANVQHWGRKFFEEGAESTRIAAFYSAYRQFKDINPTKSIGRPEQQWILARAADLDHNMSRAFNSSMHTGGAGLFGQFYAYAMRLFELMTGKRLTVAEKARMVVGSSLIWGVPMGGLGLYGFPFGDLVRQQLIQNYGYFPGNNMFESTIMEGVPAVMHSMITGEWYDYSKFGTKGVDPVLDLIEGDKSLWEVFGGATIQTFHDAWKRTSPIIWGMSDVAQGNIKLSFQDLISPLKEYTAINDAVRLHYALETGKWISKNETYMTDVDRASAWFMTITGLQKTDVTDMAIFNASTKEQKDWTNFFINNYVREMNRANTALINDDRDAHDRHMKNATVWFNKIPMGMHSSALSAARAGMTPLVDRAKWNFYHNPRNIPPGQEQFRSNISNQRQQ